MAVEFDPRCQTSQPEDVFTAYLPTAKQVLFSQLTRAPDRIVIVPGNELECSMQAASNYLGNVPRCVHQLGGVVIELMQ